MDWSKAKSYLFESAVYRCWSIVLQLGFLFLWFRSWELITLLTPAVVVLNFAQIGGFALWKWVWAHGRERVVGFFRRPRADR